MHEEKCKGSLNLFRSSSKFLLLIVGESFKSPDSWKALFSKLNVPYVHMNKIILINYYCSCVCDIRDINKCMVTITVKFYIDVLF